MAGRAPLVLSVHYPEGEEISELPRPLLEPGTKHSRVIRSGTRAVVLALLASACAPETDTLTDNSAFRAAAPETILILPVRNRSESSEAASHVLATLPEAVVERGYVVFPAQEVEEKLAAADLSDPDAAYEANIAQFDRLFACDAALFATVYRWDTDTYLRGSTTYAKVAYELRRCDTGTVIWSREVSTTHAPTINATGNPAGDVVAAAIMAAALGTDPDHETLARQVNETALDAAGEGLPAGPGLSEAEGNDGVAAAPDVAGN